MGLVKFKGRQAYVDGGSSESLVNGITKVELRNRHCKKILSKDIKTCFDLICQGLLRWRWNHQQL
jgi:hypothetical protein